MYFLSVSSSLPFRKAVFGVWPMARNTPVTGFSSSGSPTVLGSRTPVTPSLSLPNTSARVRFQRISIFGLPSARCDHDLRRPQLVAAVDQVDRAGELAEIVGLFDGRIAAADDGQRLVAEPRQGPVADGTGADAAILVLLFGGQAEVVRPGAGGHDHRVRLVVLPSEAVSRNGLARKSTSVMSSVTMRVPKLTACCRISSISSGPLTPCLSCGAHQPARSAAGRVEISAQIAGGKAGIVFHFGCQGQLAQRQRAGQTVFFGDGPLEDQRLQVGAGRVDGGRPSGGTAADDDDFFGHASLSSVPGRCLPTQALRA